MSRIREFLDNLKRRFTKRAARNQSPRCTERVSFEYNPQKHLVRSADLLARESTILLSFLGSTNPKDAAKKFAREFLVSLFGPDIAEQAIREGEDDLNVLSQESSTNSSSFFDARNPFGYWTRYVHQFRIEQAAKSLGYSLSFRPIIRTSPTGRVNAMAIPFTGPRQRIILVEDGLKAFSNLLCKAVVSAWSNLVNSTFRPGFPAQIEEIDQVLDEHSESMSRFEKVFFSYLFHGHPIWADFATLQDEPSGLDVFALHEPQLKVADTVETSMDLFVIGHEYGHIIADHSGTTRNSSLLFGGKQTKETLWNWEEEYQADKLGLHLLLKATEKTNPDCILSYCGADLFFSLIDLVQRGVALIKTGKELVPNSETHPPTAQRRKKLRELVQIHIGAERCALARHVAETFEYIVTRFFNRAVPTLRQLHSQGKPLAPIWY